MSEANLLILYAYEGAYILLKTGDKTHGVSYNFSKSSDMEDFISISKLVTPKLKTNNKVRNYNAFALQYHLSNFEDNQKFNTIKDVLQIA